MPPSDRALRRLEKATKAANREVKSHLEAGFWVYGRRRGVPTWLKRGVLCPKKKN